MHAVNGMKMVGLERKMVDDRIRRRRPVSDDRIVATPYDMMVRAGRKQEEEYMYTLASLLYWSAFFTNS